MAFIWLQSKAMLGGPGEDLLKIFQVSGKVRSQRTRQMSMNHWRVAGALNNPNGILLNLYKPMYVMRAVF